MRIKRLMEEKGKIKCCCYLSMPWRKWVDALGRPPLWCGAVVLHKRTSTTIEDDEDESIIPFSIPSAPVWLDDRQTWWLSFSQKSRLAPQCSTQSLGSHRYKYTQSQTTNSNARSQNILLKITESIESLLESFVNEEGMSCPNLLLG